MSPRRRRSQSPPSSYVSEVPERRRRRLLAEKVMSLETYHRLLLDSKSPWGKTAAIGTTAIPVPLGPNENTGDYQQKFEFWLAQRNVTLASLRDNVIQERNYRCGYAQWRVQKRYGHTTPVSVNVTTAYGRQRSRSRSPMWSRKRYEQEGAQYSSSRPRSLERNSVRQGAPESFSVPASTDSTPRTSRFYDVRRRVTRKYDEEKSRESEACCNKCDRKWADLSRRLKQLERVVSRLEVPPASAFNAVSSSSYEFYGETEPSRGASSPTFIDLTDDIDPDMDADSSPMLAEGKESKTSADIPAEDQARSVEITPTDSETNHESSLTTGGPNEPTTPPVDDFELKSLPELTLLIHAYNQLNDQVLMAQRGEKVRAEENRVSSGELLGQIRNRDAAIAAIIVCIRAENREELEHELENATASGAASEQDDLHEKCGGIASKLAEKDNELARLQKQLRPLSSLPMSTEECDGALGRREAQELSSKIRLEKASKTSLETERNKIFTRLMKSSRQIQELVTKELSSKMQRAC